MRLAIGSPGAMALDMGGDGGNLRVEVSPALAYVDRDMYEGDYTVVPDFEGKTLQTEHRTMAADVRVEPITVHSVSNDAGGRTLTIGG